MRISKRKSRRCVKHKRYMCAQKLEADLKESVKSSEEFKKANETYKSKIDLLEKKTTRERQKSLIEYCTDKNSRKHTTRASENKSPIKKEGLTERKKYIYLRSMFNESNTQTYLRKDSHEIVTKFQEYYKKIVHSNSQNIRLTKSKSISQYKSSNASKSSKQITVESKINTTHFDTVDYRDKNINVYCYSGNAAYQKSTSR